MLLKLRHSKITEDKANINYAAYAEEEETALFCFYKYNKRRYNLAAFAGLATAKPNFIRFKRNKLLLKTCLLCGEFFCLKNKLYKHFCKTAYNVKVGDIVTRLNLKN